MKALLMRSARAPLALLLCVALGACAVGPNYVRPSAPTSPVYKEAAGWTPATPADALDRGDWWTLFGDPVLNGLEARVKVSNQNVASAEAAYRQARALVSQQRAALFPTVSLSGSGTRSGSEGGGAVIVNSDGSTSGGVGGGTRSTYRASLGATWEPDVWGRVRRTVEGAKASAQASEADLASATLSAQGELAADYFGLRESDTEVALDQATVDGYARSLKITQNRYEAGTIAHSDLLQQQTQLLNAQADLAAAQQRRATYEHAIAVLVGEAPGNFTLAAVTPATISPTIPDVPVGVPSTLLQRRPDIAAAERRMANANAQVGVQRAAYFPAITLSGSYGFAATELGSLFSASNSLWSYGLAIAETVFDGGARHARVTGAKAAYDQAVAQYRQTVLTALQGVEDQLIAAKVQAQEFELRRQASVAADQAEAMVGNRYRAGQVSFIELFTAQNSAYAARRALAQAAAQRQTTAVALIQALGGGWKAP